MPPKANSFTMRGEWCLVFEGWHRANTLCCSLSGMLLRVAAKGLIDCYRDGCNWQGVEFRQYDLRQPAAREFYTHRVIGDLISSPSLDGTFIDVIVRAAVCFETAHICRVALNHIYVYRTGGQTLAATGAARLRSCTTFLRRLSLPRLRCWPTRNRSGRCSPSPATRPPLRTRPTIIRMLPYLLLSLARQSVFMVRSMNSEVAYVLPTVPTRPPSILHP